MIADGILYPGVDQLRLIDAFPASDSVLFLASSFLRALPPTGAFALALHLG